MMLDIIVILCVKVMKDNDTSQIKIHPHKIDSDVWICFHKDPKISGGAAKIRKALMNVYIKAFLVPQTDAIHIFNQE
jgi:hypothetical protein